MSYGYDAFGDECFNRSICLNSKLRNAKCFTLSENQFTASITSDYIKVIFQRPVKIREDEVSYWFRRINYPITILVIHL